MVAEAEATAEQVEADKAKPAEQDAAKAKGAQGDAEGTVPKAEYDKLQADLDNFKRIEEERKGKEKKRQEELLKEQGKFKELYDTAQRELDGLREKVAKQDEVLKGILEEELKDVPADFDKTLIPAGSVHEQILWIRKAKPVFIGAKPDARRGDGTPAARPNEGLTGMRGIYNHPSSPKH